MRWVAIDPGNTESAYVIFDDLTFVEKAKVQNEELIENLRKPAGNFVGVEFMVLERIAAMGMAVGETVFETVYWSGKFVEAFAGKNEEKLVARIKRHEVKMHICEHPRAKDPNIRQALIDRFGEQGTKKNPGPTYGFAKDTWAALAVGVTWWDNRKKTRRGD